MEQHPIPQQISSYQFKLVGDMTLKQFFQVAGGVIISLIFYSTPLHPIIKWPLILFFAGMGAAMAFLPFQERPLEKWIIAFFRSIYSPTLYTWKKTDKPPVFYTEEAVVPTITTIPTPNSQTTDKNTTNLEDAEKSFLSKIGGLWNVSNTPASTPVQTSVVQTQHINNPTAPTAPFVSPTTIQTQNPEPNKAIPPTPAPLTVPQQVPTVITKSAPKLVVQESAPLNTPQAEITNIDGQKIEEKEITSSTVEFSVDAAPPSPPIAINTIVGQVMDADRKIVEGAILEIKDSAGRPVRALKSNKAGHFIIVTPLANGKYEVTTEKDGFKFEPVSFDAVGEMIPPIAIKGAKI
ncbi:MAG: PrgI family protein [Microgenomates group bacterium]